MYQSKLMIGNFPLLIYALPYFAKFLIPFFETNAMYIFNKVFVEQIC